MLLTQLLPFTSRTAMAYFFIIMPYLCTPGALFFDGQNITHFFDLYDQFYSDYRLLESEKIYQLLCYVSILLGDKLGF